MSTLSKTKNPTTHTKPRAKEIYSLLHITQITSKWETSNWVQVSSCLQKGHPSLAEARASPCSTYAVPTGSSALTKGTVEPISQTSGASKSIYRKMPHRQRSGKKNGKLHLVCPQQLSIFLFLRNPQTLLLQGDIFSYFFLVLPRSEKATI